MDYVYLTAGVIFALLIGFLMPWWHNVVSQTKWGTPDGLRPELISCMYAAVAAVILTIIVSQITNVVQDFGDALIMLALHFGGISVGLFARAKKPTLPQLKRKDM